MINPSYDSLEKSLLTLDDSVFFHILKNYLGKLETPFHKPTLIKRLIKFLSSKDTKSRILQLLDLKDKIILNTIYKFHSPSIITLRDHLLQEFSYFEFLSSVQNLEERLLIYEYDDRFFINPIFLSEMHETVFHLNWNVRSEPFTASSPTHPWLSEIRFFCLLGNFFQKGSVFSKDGTVRKKLVSDSISSIFSKNDTDEDVSIFEQRINILYTAMEKLGFTARSLSEILVKTQRIKEFGKLKVYNRMVYIWSSYLICKFNSEIWPGTHQTAEIITSLLQSLPKGTGYDKKSLIYLVGLIEPTMHHQVRLFLIDGLIELDILNEENELIGLTPYLDTNQFEISENGFEDNNYSSCILFNSSMGFSLNAHYSFDALLLSILTAEVLHVDYIAQFEITRNTLHKGAIFFEKPIPEEYKLFAAEISQSTDFTLSQWSEQLDDVLVYSGITIKVKERYITQFENITEELPVFKITEGIYIIQQDMFSVLESLLTQQGLLVPGIVEPGEKKQSLLSSRLTVFKSLTGKKIEAQSLTSEEENDTSPEFLDTLYAHLAASRLERNEREEIDGKIKNKLILFESQINKEICRKDKVEARGVDYQGKINLIQQCIKNKEDLLQIEMFDDSFEIVSLLVMPERMIKDNQVYILEAKQLPDESTIKYTVSQLSKVRRIRKSLYGQ